MNVLRALRNEVNTRKMFHSSWTTCSCSLALEDACWILEMQSRWWERLGWRWEWSFWGGSFGAEVQGFNTLRGLSRYSRGKQLVEFQLPSIICPLEINIQISSLKNFHNWTRQKNSNKSMCLKEIPSACDSAFRYLALGITRRFFETTEQTH